MAVVRGSFTSHGGELCEELYRGRKGHDVRAQRLSPVRLKASNERLRCPWQAIELKFVA
jgi:hypothetical protein